MYDIKQLKLLSKRIINESNYNKDIKLKLLNYIQNEADEYQLKNIIMNKSITSLHYDDTHNIINYKFNNFINEINNEIIQDTKDFINICRETIYNYLESTKEYNIIELKEIKNFVFNESSFYQILSIILDNNIPDDKENIKYEKKYIEHINENYGMNLICLSETQNKKKKENENNNEPTAQKQNVGNAVAQTGKEIGGMAGQLAMYSVVGTGVGKGIQKGGELLGKGYQAAKTGISGMSQGAKMGLGGLAAAAMLGYAAYKVYQNYLSKAARACANSDDKSSCIDVYKKNALRQQISKLQSGMGQCNKALEPYKCRASIQNNIEKLRKKLF